MKKVLLVSIALLLIGCKPTNTVKVESSDVLQTEVIHPVVMNGPLVDPTHGKQIAFSYGALSGVNGTSASGISYVHVFNDQTTIITLNLNIKDMDGVKFIGWIGEGENPSTWIKMSDFFAPFGDVRHGMRFEIAQNLSAYNSIIVTAETNLATQTPGKIVASGITKNVPQK